MGAERRIECHFQFERSDYFCAGITEYLSHRDIVYHLLDSIGDSVPIRLCGVRSVVQDPTDEKDVLDMMVQDDCGWAMKFALRLDGQVDKI